MLCSLLKWIGNERGRLDEKGACNPWRPMESYERAAPTR